MEQAITKLARHVYDQLAEQAVEKLVAALDDPKRGNKTTKEVVKGVIDSVLTGLPKPKTSGTSNKSGGSKNLPVLTNDKGEEIQCEIEKKKGGLCSHMAKYKVNGQYVCGIHNASLTKAKPDAKKAPKAKEPAKNKSESYKNMVTNNHFDDTPDLVNDPDELEDDDE